REVDFLALLQADVRLFPAAPPPGVRTEALRLSAHVHDLHARDLELLFLPHQLDGRLHVLFGRVGPHAEDDLVVTIGDLRSLLRHHRREENGHQTLFAHGRRRGLRFRFAPLHPRISSKRLTAALVSSTFSKRTSVTGSTALASTTRTFGRLRDDSCMFS